MKPELNKHISVFVKMLRECLRSVGHVSPELQSRLDMYVCEARPVARFHRFWVTRRASSSSRGRNDSFSSSVGLSMNVMDMDMVKAVASVFQRNLQDVQREGVPDEALLLREGALILLSAPSGRR